MSTFVEFPKISRLFRDIVITEKLDGTNASVSISPILLGKTDPKESAVVRDLTGNPMAIRAGSRTRWISPDDDNFGFAAWVHANANQLVDLGEGTHFGEWWGRGIQRGYGLQERRFSLFNTSRWDDEDVRPKCCHVVPTLYVGPMDTADIQQIAKQLAESGSEAAPGFINPEGIVIFHAHSNSLFKYTLKNDAAKGARP